MTEPPQTEGQDLVLAELLDRLLHRGVVLRGDVVISVAGIDLVYLAVQLLVSSIDTAERLRGAAPASTPRPAGRPAPAAGE